MPKFEVGQPRPANAGRRKGTPNKHRLGGAVHDALADMALRMMPSLELEFQRILKKDPSLLVVRELMKLVSAAARYPGYASAGQPSSSEHIPPAKQESSDEPVPAMTRQEFDAIPLSNELKEDDDVEMAQRFSQIVDAEIRSDK